MNDTEKIGLIAELLEIEPVNLNSETELASIPTWDSMTSLSLILLLEERFERSDIDGNQIKNFKSIGDILNVMEKSSE